MKKALIVFSAAFLFACKGGKNENKPAAENTGTTTATTSETAPPATTTTSSSGVAYTVDGVEIKNGASLLVTKDKEKLQAGLPYMCMLTSNAASNNNEYLTLNFLIDTKPGTYPVVGSSLTRGKSPNDEMYGGLLGGKPKLTEYKVNITECKDLGDNTQGGHKWSISGTWEEVTIKAPGMMLLDPAKKHPKEIKVTKGSFNNLTFDDNWGEMLEKGLKQLKKS